MQTSVATNPRILLVEDDQALREALAEVLAERGYEVACAGDGREALEALGRRPTPEVILLDLAMPVMDGWAFRDAQRSDPAIAGIPTIVLSSSLKDGRSLESLAPTAAFTKPFDLDRLLDALRHACEPPLRSVH